MKSRILRYANQQKGSSGPFLTDIFIEKLDCGLNRCMIDNKYTKIYNQITTRAISRTIIGYRENHHVVPRSMGGTNAKSNMVALTAREHFICHWLLTKMVTGADRAKMVYALRMMRVSNDLQNRYETKITARVYEKYKKEHAINLSIMRAGRPAWNKGIKLEGEALEKSRERTRNRKPQSPETKAAVSKMISERQTGSKRSITTKAKMSAASKGILKGPHSEQHKLAISLGGKGVKKVSTHGASVAAANRGCISINKDNIEKKVKAEVLDSWLSQGWKLGGRKRLAQ